MRCFCPYCNEPTTGACPELGYGESARSQVRCDRCGSTFALVLSVAKVREAPKLRLARRAQRAAACVRLADQFAAGGEHGSAARCYQRAAKLVPAPERPALLEKSRSAALQQLGLPAEATREDAYKAFRVAFRSENFDARRLGQVQAAYEVLCPDDKEPEARAMARGAA